MSSLRQHILNMLKEATPGYLSGEKVARQFSVSRTAVWKSINSLKEEGYYIEGSSRLGYRLLYIPDSLYPAEITNTLNTSLVAASTELVYHYTSVDSTNEVLKQLSERDIKEGTVIVAEEQTKGRGRRERSWFSPQKGGIYLSLLLKPKVSPEETPLFSLLSAVAITKGIKKILPNLALGIKWPNDIFINNRKICGILIDLKAEAELLHQVIIGIGINVNIAPGDFPPELKDTATSLYIQNNEQKVPRSKLAASILEELEGYYLLYLSQGASPIIAEWKKYNITLDKKVTVTSVQRSLEGYTRDIDLNGALLVEIENGSLIRCFAGEVSLS